MMRSRTLPRRVQRSEEGFVLIAVIFLVALLTLSLAIAMPKVIKQIQRDRDLETMNRGKQYARAIKMYYKKFGAYPPNMDALTKPTNNIRFLRKKYSDPTTGKEDWKPIPVGMNKAPTFMGFFNQPLGQIGGCGTNPAGTGSPGATGSQQSNSSFSFSSFSNSSSNGGTPGSPTDPNANANCAGLGPGGTPSSGGVTNPTDPNAGNATPAGQNGQTLGGLSIMGFSPNSPKASIMVYKTKHKYNEWEFVYDPKAEQMMALGGMGGAGSAGQNGGLGGTNGQSGGFGGLGGMNGQGGGFGGLGGMNGQGGMGSAMGGSSGGQNSTSQPSSQ